MNKTLNLIIMVLMFALAIKEGYSIVQTGANSTNVIFFCYSLPSACAACWSTTSSASSSAAVADFLPIAMPH